MNDRTDDDRTALLHELQAIAEACLDQDPLDRVPRLISHVCATLRRIAQGAVATQYASAFDRWQAAIAIVATGAAFSDDVNAAAIAAKDDASAEFVRLTLELFAGAGKSS